MKTWTPAILAGGLIAGTAIQPALAESVDESRSAAVDGRIEFSGVTGDFEIIGHDAEEFLLSGDLGDDVEELVIEGDASHWKIELKMKKGRYSGGGSDLRLLVPNGTDLEARAVSADMVLRALRGPAVEVHTVSGDIDLEGVAPAELMVQSVSGDVAADASASRLNRFQTVSGDIEVASSSGRIEGESVSGSIEIEGADVEEFAVETVSGDVSARLRPAERARVSLVTHSGDLSLYLPDGLAPQIGAVTFSGRIDSAFGGTVKSGRAPGERLTMESDSDVEINAKTFSGNVTIASFR